jgi:hypothetical protein
MVGKRGQRVTGRSGRGYRTVTMRALRAIDKAHPGIRAEGENLRTLNRRAVEVMLELRARSAGSGFLSMPWLKRRRIQHFYHKDLVANRSGTPLGKLQLTEKDGALRCNLTSYVAASRKFPQQFNLAIADEVGDMAAYFAGRKRQDMAEQILGRLARKG